MTKTYFVITEALNITPTFVFCGEDLILFCSFLQAKAYRNPTLHRDLSLASLTNCDKNYCPPLALIKLNFHHDLCASCVVGRMGTLLHLWITSVHSVFVQDSHKGNTIDFNEVTV